MNSEHKVFRKLRRQRYGIKMMSVGYVLIGGMPSSGENFLQKQYRLMGEHPFVFCTLFGIFMVAAMGRDYLDKIVAGESLSAVLPEFLFILALGVVFFYFAFRFMAWLMLKSRGDSIEGDRQN